MKTPTNIRAYIINNHQCECALSWLGEVKYHSWAWTVWLADFGSPGTVPLAAFALALAIYLAGTPLYQRVPPGGSALTRIAQVPGKCKP